MNHAATSKAFSRYPYPQRVRHVEMATEFLASDWPLENSDSAYETNIMPKRLARLKQAVMEMGNGDRNKGMEVLKRAYFGGDLAALEVLRKYLPPEQPV